MTTCDHTIGVCTGDDGDFIRASEEAEAAAFAKRAFDKFAKNPHAIQRLVDSRTGYTARQHLEERYDMFAFCPDCGAPLK